MVESKICFCLNGERKSKHFVGRLEKNLLIKILEVKEPIAVAKRILPKANLPMNEYSMAHTTSRSDKVAKNALSKGSRKGLANPI